jgi:hypothetical protein
MAYKIYGTNQSYSGKVIKLGNKLYSTVGGALEGDSKEVIETQAGTGNSGNQLAVMNSTQTAAQSTDNPVTDLFNAPASPRYYKPNGAIVPIGAPLHRHADGTIMTEHTMGPNDNSVVVTTTRTGTPITGTATTPTPPTPQGEYGETNPEPVAPFPIPLTTTTGGGTGGGNGGGMGGGGGY